MKNFIKSKIKLNIYLVLLSIITITSSCEDSMVEDVSDSTLIEQIQNSDITEISFNLLPESSQTNIQNSYIPFGDIPLKSFESPSLGYKVNLSGPG
ncbi:MAG: hypothetical protein ISR02_01150, partial [Flavobacteriales bacterium]|nr:hypothetical protein [Flavobacteriales bacterium]